MSTESIQQINLRLLELNQKVDHLYEHLGIEPPAPQQPSMDVSPEVLELARGGKLIEAIKLYRDQTNADLATAKAVVERAAGGGLIL